MGKIITYKNNDKEKFCQIKLENVERILISIANEGLAIFKLSFFGMIPGGKIWEEKDVRRAFMMFMQGKQGMDLLSEVVDIVKECSSVENVVNIIHTSYAEKQKQWDLLK